MGMFKLATSAGTDSEAVHSKQGKLYYLSTTRSKFGDYTNSSSYVYGVVMVLNGDWFNTKYKAGAIDYWGTGWNKDEMEDRVLSTEPYIDLPEPATKAITAIHILFIQNRIDTDSKTRVHLRKLLIAAKTKGIPCFVYDNKNSWMTQDTRKAIPLTKEFVAGLNAEMPKPYGRMSRDYLEVWRELYYKRSVNELSRDAKKKLDYLSGWYMNDAIRTLAADIHNEKASGSPGLVNLIKIFQKLKISTAKQYIEYLNQKWKDN